MQRLEVSCAVRHIYVVRRQRVNYIYKRQDRAQIRAKESRIKKKCVTRVALPARYFEIFSYVCGNILKLWRVAKTYTVQYIQHSAQNMTQFLSRTSLCVAEIINIHHSSSTQLIMLHYIIRGVSRL
jgi:hypothetical protein